MYKRKNYSYNISQVENANFGERKHKLKQDFKKIVEVDILEGMSRELTSFKQDVFSAIDDVKKSCCNNLNSSSSWSPYS